VVNDYMHKATSIVVKTCVKHGISKVVVGDVVKSLNGINEELREPTKTLSIYLSANLWSSWATNLGHTASSWW
jgi:transposase